MSVIDSLDIEIKADSSKAVSSIDSLIGRLGTLQKSLNGLNIGTKFDSMSTGLERVANIDGSNIKSISASLSSLSNSINKLSGDNVQRAANALPALGRGLRSFDGISVGKIDGVEGLTQGLRSLGSKTVVQAANAMPTLVSALKEVKDIKLPEGLGGITELSNSIRSFGYKSATTAIENIPKIATAFNQMASTLSKAPIVSNNTIRLAEAMGRLAQNGVRVGTGVGRASTGIALFSKNAVRSQKSVGSLASTIGKITATYWLLFRALGKVKEAIDLSSDLTEVQNVVDQTFKGESSKMNEFAKDAIKNFGMAELQAKQVGSRFQAMGSALEISNASVAKSSEFLAKNSKEYGKTAKSMADMSIELTKLTADMGSFYNMEYSDVAKDMESIFTGQTRPMRTYGIDLTEATMKQWALNNGLNANFKSMTQAEKAMLRYQYVLAHTGAAQGDFIRTADTWANQTRMLKQNFQQLGVVVGKTFINAFKPAVKAMNSFILKVTSFAEQVFNALGQIFGWEIEIDAKGIADDYEDASIGADNLASGTGDAAKNAKELNKQLAGFDRLNNLTSPNKNSGGGSGGSGVSGGGGGAGGGDEGSVKSRFKKIKSDIKDLETLGETIAKTIADSLSGINWKKDVYPKAKNFGKGLADFMNGLFAGDQGKRLFKNLGKTIAGAVNTVMIAADTWASTLEWGKIGENIKDGLVSFLTNWKPEIQGRAVANIVSGIANAVYAMVSDRSAWKLLGEKIGKGINSFITTMGEVNKDTGKTGWQALFGDVVAIADGIGSAVIEAIKQINWPKLLVGAFDGLVDALGNMSIEGLGGIGVIVGIKLLASKGKALTASVLSGMISNSLAGLGIGGAGAGAAGAGAGAAGGVSLATIAIPAALVIGAVIVSEKVKDKMTEIAQNGGQFKTSTGKTVSKDPMRDINKAQADRIAKDTKYNTMTYALGVDLKLRDGKKSVAKLVSDASKFTSKSALPMGVDFKEKQIKKAVNEASKYSTKSSALPIPVEFKKDDIKKAVEKSSKYSTTTYPLTGEIKKVEDKSPSKDKIISNLVGNITNTKFSLTEAQRVVETYANFTSMTYNAERTIDTKANFTSKDDKKISTIITKALYTSKDDSKVKTINTKALYNSKDDSKVKTINTKAFYTSKNDSNVKTINTKANYTSKSVSDNVKNITTKALITQLVSATGQTPTIDVKANIIELVDKFGKWGSTSNAYAKRFGGIFNNGKWHNIPQFASGGRPTHGSMFIAGENGSEIVGHVGGQTEVLNESQLASVMYSAVSSAMSQQNAILTKQNEYLAGILAKNYGISSQDIFTATRTEATSYFNRTGQAPYPT